MALDAKGWTPVPVHKQVIARVDRKTQAEMADDFLAERKLTWLTQLEAIALDPKTPVGDRIKALTSLLDRSVPRVKVAAQEGEQSKLDSITRNFINMLEQDSREANRQQEENRRKALEAKGTDEVPQAVEGELITNREY